MTQLSEKGTASLDNNGTAGGTLIQKIRKIRANAGQSALGTVSALMRSNDVANDKDFRSDDHDQR
jgi:hypothetical protein